MVPAAAMQLESCFLGVVPLTTEAGQRLMGASVLIFANKTDVEGCMSNEEITEVCMCVFLFTFSVLSFS